MNTTMSRNVLVSKLFGFGLIALAMGCFIAPAFATVLTMDVRSTSDVYSDGVALPLYNNATYGSNVTASDLATFQTRPSNHNYYGSAGGETPNIATNWSESGASFVRYNDVGGIPWDKVLYPNAVAASLFIAFDPQPGFAVSLTSFTLSNYFNVTTSTGFWAVHDSTSGGTILTNAGSQTNWSRPINSTSPATLSIGYTGLVDQTLVLEYHANAGGAGGGGGNTGFDSLQFSQIAEVVPEPNSFALLLFGMGALLTIRRRRTI